MRLLALAAGTMLWVNHRPALKQFGATTSEFYIRFLEETEKFIAKTRKLQIEGPRRAESAKSSRQKEIIETFVRYMRSAVRKRAKFEWVAPPIFPKYNQEAGTLEYPRPEKDFHCFPGAFRRHSFIYQSPHRHPLAAQPTSKS